MFELIAVSAAAFAFAFAGGWFAPNSRVWRLQGLLIYPLGAIGTVFVFLATEQDRASFPLEMRKEAADRTIAELESQRPDVTDSGMWADSSPELFGMIYTLKGLGDACTQAPDVSAQCIVAAKSVDGLGLALEALEDYKGEPNAELRLIALCESFEHVVTKLRTDGAIDDDVASHVAQKFREGFSSTGGHAFTLSGEFEQEATKRIDETFSKLGPDYDIVREMNVREVILGRALLIGYGACFSAPEAVRTGRLQAWLGDIARQTETSAQTSRELAMVKIDETQVRAAKFVQLSLWPYMLIAIFALQFGKTVSEIQNRKSAGDPPSTTDASIVATVASADAGGSSGTSATR